MPAPGNKRPQCLPRDNHTLISPEWAQSSSRLDAFVNVFSWFTAYGQAGTADAMTQGANNLNAMQQIASSSASYMGQASAVAKSSMGLRIVDRVAASTYWQRPPPRYLQTPLKCLQTFPHVVSPHFCDTQRPPPRRAKMILHLSHGLHDATTQPVCAAAARFESGG